MESEQTTAEQMEALVKQQPRITAAQAAVHLGITRQRASQIAKSLDLKLMDGRRSSSLKRDGQWKNQWGRTEGMPSNFVAGAGELTAAADLLRRGIAVYRSCTSVSSCDLIADVKEKLLRIEVRCAKRRASGELVFGRPKDRYDVLALVDQTGAVTYRPKSGIEWPE